MADNLIKTLPRRENCSLIYDAADTNGGDTVSIPDEPPHVVRDGETLFKIALHYRQSVAVLCERNPHLRGLAAAPSPAPVATTTAPTKSQAIENQCAALMVKGTTYHWPSDGQSGSSIEVFTVSEVKEYPDRYFILGEFMTTGGTEAGGYFCEKPNDERELP